MLKTFGTKKKLFMVGVMITVTVGLIIYLVKKVLQQREEYMKYLKDKEMQGHAESAIYAEQAEQKIKDITPHHVDIKHDLQQYQVYKNYIPVYLWSNYKYLNSKHNFANQLPHQTLPQIELTTFYQSFTKIFSVTLVSLSKLSLFRTADSKLIKVKLMLFEETRLKSEIESTKTYALNEEVLIDERFTFYMKEKDFDESTLNLTIWGIDVFHQEILLGAVSIGLNLYDHTIRRSMEESFIPVKKDTNIYGYLLVLLCRLPVSERLACVVMSGKDFIDDIKNKSVLDKRLNTYVKIALLNDGKLIKRYRTAVAADTSEPLFNEMIDFYIPRDQMNAVDILFLVTQDDQNNSSRTIGRLLIGCHAHDVAKEHWNKMMENQETSIAMWHPLTR